MFLMQKKIVRTIHSVRPRTHTEPLFGGSKLYIYTKYINEYEKADWKFNV